MAAAYIHEKTISTFQITWYRKRRRFLCAWSLKWLMVIHILRQTRLRLHHWWFQPIWKMCSFNWIINGGVEHNKTWNHGLSLIWVCLKIGVISLHQLVYEIIFHMIVGHIRFHTAISTFSRQPKHKKPDSSGPPRSVDHAHGTQVIDACCHKTDTNWIPGI